MERSSAAGSTSGGSCMAQTRATTSTTMLATGGVGMMGRGRRGSALRSSAVAGMCSPAVAGMPTEALGVQRKKEVLSIGS